MNWAYGVTSVSERLDDLLPRTLKSLSAAGFDDPYLFLDDTDTLPEHLSAYHHVLHCPRLRCFGNWIVAAWSLYIRSPHADRFAIFQDDLITYCNLRPFLEQCDMPEHTYFNLYTFPSNERGKGWHLSNQRGLGAVALVFSNEGLRVLLSSRHMIERPLDVKRGHKAIDGGIVTAFKKAGWSEMVHSPSLTQHTGTQSSMENRRHPTAKSFRGENFDAMELLKG